MICLYAILTLGLNLQWGFAGLFNAGIAGFFAVGAYTTSILTTPESADHLGGFSLPIPLGILAGVLLSAVLGYAVARICLRLKSDYLAIATIGIAEILRLVLKNESWMTNGSRGIAEIPRPFEGMAQPWGELCFLLVTAAVVVLLYVTIERAWHSPWGRTLRAIRENDEAAEAAGKDVIAYRAQVFTLGSAVMGLAGGAHGPLPQIHRPRCDGADPHHLPRLGHADRRRQRQQPGRPPGRGADLAHLVGDGAADPAPAARIGRRAPPISASSSSGCCSRSCCSASPRDSCPSARRNRNDRNRRRNRSET